MSRAWRVLDLTEVDGEVRSRRGQVVIRQAEQEDQVPLADVALILLGQHVSVSPGVLHHLARYDVTALVCDWRAVPYAGIFGWSTNSRVAARHIAQASVSKPRLKNAWMQLVRAKVLGQARTLDIVDSLGAEHLLDLANMIRSGDPNNIEAAAARWYWSRLFIEREFTRDQEGTDHTNSFLNYGYGVIRGLGIRAVLAAGLAPPLGAFHSNRSNYFNLVEDLIEPYRPVVDAAVSGFRSARAWINAM